MASVTQSPKVILTHAICMEGEGSVEANQYSKSEKNTADMEGVCLWVYSRRSVWWNLWVTAPSTHTHNLCEIKVQPVQPDQVHDRGSSELPWMGRKLLASIHGPVLTNGVSRVSFIITAHSQFSKWKVSLDNCTYKLFLYCFVFSFVPGL